MKLQKCDLHDRNLRGASCSCVPSSNQESAEELSARAVKVNGAEWTSFDDLFYHGCCDCGLSHAVRIRRLDDGGHENQWTFHAELTDRTRKSGRHPLWDEVLKLRAEIAKWQTNCTGKHGSQMPCVESSRVETTDRIEHLEFVLRGFYWDQVDYIKRNHLGGMNNHWMRATRIALGIQPDDPIPSVEPTEVYTQEALDAAHARTRERLSKLKIDPAPENGSPVTWTCPSCSMRGRPADAYVCTNCGEKRPENERT